MTLRNWGLRDWKLLWSFLNRACLFQGAIGSVFVNCLEPTGGDPHSNEFLQLRHPDPVFVQVGSKDPRYVLGDVTANATLLLGHTAPMDRTPSSGARTSNLTNLGHNEKAAQSGATLAAGQAIYCPNRRRC